MKRIAAIFALLLFSLAYAWGEEVSPPPYQPSHSVSGVIRVWGNGQMRALVQQWETGFRKYHPQAHIEPNLTGSDVGMAGLYTGLADIALLGRESTADEKQAFEWVFGYKPAQVEVMTGSLNKSGKSPALVVFVHKGNPISQLTLAQVEAIFGYEHQRSTANIRTWGQLNSGGQWARQSIKAYAYDAETGSGKFFRHVVLNDSRKMNWDHLTEFTDKKNRDGSIDESGRQILAALAEDRFGIAVSSLQFMNSKVKPIALASTESGPYYQATKENLISRKYPLARGTYAYINRPARLPVDPNVKEFLHYILSNEGQNIVHRDGQYLPLTIEATREQLLKLE